MGQYFKPVNVTKQEYICPWCIGAGAKLWEWAANPCGAIFVLLLRRSSQTGGGDFGSTKPLFIEVANDGECSDVIAQVLQREGADAVADASQIVGRWAGDEIYLVGDYDESGDLYRRAKSWRNISESVVEAWNGFIEIPELKLRFEYCGCGECPDC
ncbi:MAG: hypothetical protein KDA96_07220 [Planctomycetaceae bacterium]|nr:hypothetical protein [Planctomycetaceae bacterium]